MEKASNKLVDLSVAFAVEILNLVKYLKSQHETIICNQIGRAGTSIGAKKHEAVRLRFMARSAASCSVSCASYFAATPQNAS